MSKRMQQQRGFGSLAVLILLTAMTIVASISMRMSTDQRHGELLAEQSSRALLAAEAGLHWVMISIDLNDSCPAPSSSFPLDSAGYANYRVIVTCSAAKHVEGGSTNIVYQLVSEAGFSPSDSIDHVSRSVRLTYSR